MYDTMSPEDLDRQMKSEERKRLMVNNKRGIYPELPSHKTCPNCIKKPIDEFYTVPGYPYKTYVLCKACTNEKNMQRFKDNGGSTAALNKIKLNPERYELYRATKRAESKRWSENNPDKVKEMKRRYHKTDSYMAGKRRKNQRDKLLLRDPYIKGGILKGLFWKGLCTEDVPKDVMDMLITLKRSLMILGRASGTKYNIDNLIDQEELWKDRSNIQ